MELEANISKVLGQEVVAADLIMFLGQTTNTFDDMFGPVSCFWFGEDMKINCSDTWFTLVSTVYGKCFSFNLHPSVRDFRQGSAGTGNGLVLFINIQQDEYSGVLSGFRKYI